MRLAAINEDEYEGLTSNDNFGDEELWSGEVAGHMVGLYVTEYGSYYVAVDGVQANRRDSVGLRRITPVLVVIVNELRARRGLPLVTHEDFWGVYCDILSILRTLHTEQFIEQHRELVDESAE